MMGSKSSKSNTKTGNADDKKPNPLPPSSGEPINDGGVNGEVARPQPKGKGKGNDKGKKYVSRQ